MPEITIVEVEERRAAETVLAPNSNAPVALREGDLIGEEFARAAEPLRRLVVDAGPPNGGGGRTGPGLEISHTHGM